MDNIERSAQYVVGEAEFRNQGLGNMEKAVLLHERLPKSNVRFCARFCNVPKSTLAMNLKRKREDRDPGRPGKRRILTQEQEDILVDMCLSRQARCRPMTANDIIQTVCYDSHVTEQLGTLLARRRGP